MSITPTYNGVTAEQAAKNPAMLKAYLQGLAIEVQRGSGSDPVAPTTGASTSATTGVAPPAQGQGTVIGQDGVFLVTLAPVKDAKGANLFYQVETSDDLAFDANSNVISYGGDTGTVQTDWKLHEANQTRYIRWRSKTANSKWTSWVYYNLPTACGPFAVWSGVLRSIATALVNQALTSTGANPLTQDGTTTNIKVAASLWKAGSQKISYNAGNVDPGILGKFYVFADDPTRKGGTVVFQSSQNVDDVTNSDYRVYFGVITTSGGGGGTGIGGGNGGCPIGEVEWETPNGGKLATADMQIGDEVLSIDGGVDHVSFIESIPDQPCFSLEVANGLIFRGASSTHLMKYNFGPFQSLFELQVGDVMQTRLGPSAITKKTFIGNRTVYKIILDRTRVGYTDGFVSHNVSGK